MTPQRLRALLFAAGAAFLAWLVWDLGPGAVWETIRALRWRLALVLFIPFSAAVALDTLGWRALLPRCPAGWTMVAGARLAGEAVNLATPTASVGGEPLKAYLLRDRLPIEEGFASVVADKTTVVMGQALFLAAGLGLAAAIAAPRAVVLAMAALLLAETAGVGGFILVQIRGGMAGVGRALGRLGAASAERHRALLQETDYRLRSLYRERRGRVAWSAVLHALAWAVGGLELYVVLRLADIPVSLTTALVLEAVTSAVRFATFVIPGSLGALEGGTVAAFIALGLPGAAGLSFSLVRRLREAVWAVIGLAALAVFKART